MEQKTCLTLRAAGCVLAALLATPASAQLGNILNRLPAIPGIPNVGNIVNPPAAAGTSTSDLLQMLSDSVDRIDEPKEIEIGRGLAAVLLGSKPLHPDMRLQRYVNSLGRWISLQSERPGLPWTFGVLDDPGFNAFATPGGYIFVTKGLVDRVDEAELAGILAHEITHVTARHHLKALSTKARSGALINLAASQIRGTASMFQSQIAQLGRNLYSSGLDQGDEFEADRQGVALAARAGFDPYGLPSVLQQLRSVPADNQLFTLTMATHPPAQARLDQLEGAMGNRLDALTGKPSVPVSQRLRP